MIAHRRTLAASLTVEGLGLHSGTPVKMTVHPASDGIHFRCGQDRIAASPENVTGTTRCTQLGSISTIEHLMSAFSGLEITDAEVELTAPEVPGVDGSAGPFIEALMLAGIHRMDEWTPPTLFRRVFYHEENTKIAVARGAGHWRYDFETGTRWPGTQVFEVDSVPDRYEDQIGWARTFALEEEIPTIMKMGLGRGLDESSALILGAHGYKNEPRFVDEPARHKLLDLIGDLYLSGIPARFLNVVAERSGHAANVRVAAMIKQAADA